MNTNYTDDDGSAAKSKKLYLIGIGAAGLLVVALLATSVDCDGDEGPGNLQTMKLSGTPGLASFNKAMDLLEDLNEYETGQAEVSILRNLHAWLRDSDPDVEWVADPMISRLPKKYRMAGDDDLNTSNIARFDVQVLREASWLRDVKQTVLRANALPPGIAKLCVAIKSNSANPNVTNDLDSAVRLFDWVVRNIQTDSPVEAGSTSRYGSDAILAAWRNLLYGHGTTLEKSRVFVLLCRQAGLETVMLGIEQQDGNPREWLPAVYLDNQLYLFEMEYGTPVLTKSSDGVATLSDVMEDPSLLSVFDIDNTSYRTRRKDFSRIVAMVDATPAHLSQRMKLIEKTATGNDRLVLTVTPSPLAKRLRNTKGITRTEIWTFPYEMYRRAQELSQEGQIALGREQGLFDIRNSFSSDSSGFSRQYTERTRNVDTKVSLIQGRLLHLKGRYTSDKTGETRGALSHYFEIRPTDSELASITKPVPKNLSPKEAQAFRDFLKRSQDMLSTTKENATYWTGLAAFDKGDYRVAADWFDARYLQRTIDKKWSPGANYNAGRAYEAMANDETLSESERADLLKKAKFAYEAGKGSPQSLVSMYRLEQLQD